MTGAPGPGGRERWARAQRGAVLVLVGASGAAEVVSAAAAREIARAAVGDGGRAGGAPAGRGRRKR